MQILHLSAECYPFAKVGGLGDVVGALPKYLQNETTDAHVIFPAYQKKAILEHPWSEVHQGKLRLGPFVFSYRILKSEKWMGYHAYAVAIPELFDRPEVYSYPDDTERFLAFQYAVLNWLVESNVRPHVIHCHDHHTGLVPFLVQFAYIYQSLKNVPTVVSIHNGQYQGWFGFDKLHYLPDFDMTKAGYLEWNGIINPLASAIKCAWKVTTVSHSYLDELSEKANGLEGLLRFERYKSMGILNGIDQEVWDPLNDPLIEHHFDVNSYAEGKMSNKEFLCARFGLQADLPLFVFIGRFAGEKGADLLPDLVRTCAYAFGPRINMLILGSGDPWVENQLQDLFAHLPGHYRGFIGYHEGLAHQCYAGADFILMPSRVEPCGLNQMYAMRYGTVPIVRRIGGLKDTVVDMGDGGWGFAFDRVSVEDMVHAMSRALSLYENSSLLNQTRERIMKINHSWEQSAATYKNMYQELINRTL